MCDLTMALSVAGAVFNHIGQKQAASNENAERARVASVNARQAAEDLKRQSDAQNTKDRQRAIANSKAITEATVESAKRAATAEVAAGERGVSGLSVEQLLGDFDRGLAAHLESIDLQNSFDNEASAYNRRALEQRYENIIESQSFTPNPGPSPLDLVAGVSVAGADYYKRQERDRYDEAREVNRNG